MRIHSLLVTFEVWSMQFSGMNYKYVDFSFWETDSEFLADEV